jgi:hypothetical protein
MNFEEAWEQHGYIGITDAFTKAFKDVAIKFWYLAKANTAATPQPPPTGDGQEVLPSLLGSIDNYDQGAPYGFVSACECAFSIAIELYGHTDVEEKLKSDLTARQEAGIAKYGTQLKTHNGRDALVDAYQESLDLLMYLRQWMMEQDK